MFFLQRPHQLFFLFFISYGRKHKPNCYGQKNTEEQKDKRISERDTEEQKDKRISERDRDLGMIWIGEYIPCRE